MRKLALVLVLLLAAASAYADPVPVAFLGFSGAWQNGYPYFVSFGSNGVTPVMCDDYAHGGLPGETFLANITNLGTEDLSLTRFNQLPGALTLYDEAGWLILQTQQTNPAQWTDINFAVWHIFDSQAPLDQAAQLWFDAAEIEAGKGFPGINFSEVDILTPVNQYDPDPTSMQEFLYLVPGGTVPEPGTWLLVGTGTLIGFWRKLRQL